MYGLHIDELIQLRADLNGQFIAGSDVDNYFGTTAIGVLCNKFIDINPPSFNYLDHSYQHRWVFGNQQAYNMILWSHPAKLKPGIIAY